MKTTKNFGLKKPEAHEFYSINVQNDNMDEIDRLLQECKDDATARDSDMLGGKTAEEWQAEIDEKIEFEEAFDFEDAAEPEFVYTAQTVIETVEGFREELTETNETVAAQGKVLRHTAEALDNRIKKFYTNNLGENHIADSDDGVFRNIRIEGNSEQVTTTGAQLIVPVSKKTMNIAGVVVTYEDGIVTMNGTATGTTTLALVTIQGGFLPPLEANTTYCLSTEPRNTYEQGKTYAQYWSNVVGVEGQTKNAGYGVFTTGTNEVGETDANIGIYVEEGVIYNNYSFSVQFEKASAPSPHEPYTGGQPSPSPDYPQEIKSVENAAVRVNGKNLIPYPFDVLASSLKPEERVKTNNGLTFQVVEGDGIKVRGTPTADYVDIYLFGGWGDDRFKLLDGEPGAYTVSVFGTDIQHTNVVKNKNVVITGTHPQYSRTFNLSEDDYLNAIFIRFTKDEVVDTTVYVMLESGTTATPHQPYVPEQLAPIPVTLRSVGEGENAVRDVLYVYADGTGKLVQRVKQKRITACDYYNLSLNMAFCNLIYYPIRSKELRAFSTHFSYDSRVYENKKDWTFYAGTTNTADWSDYMRAIIKCPDGVFTTRDEVTNWLSEREVYVLYPLYEPIETALTTEQAKALFDLRTHYGGTHISFQSENGVEPTINFDYACSLENFVEYVKQQQNDERKIIYDMDDRLTDSEYMSALAYVNSEYATALVELGV